MHVQSYKMQATGEGCKRLAPTCLQRRGGGGEVREEVSAVLPKSHNCLPDQEHFATYLAAD